MILGFVVLLNHELVMVIKLIRFIKLSSKEKHFVLDIGNLVRI